MTVCLVFSIIALILSLIAAVCGVLGLLVAKTVPKKRKLYTVAGGLMCFVGRYAYVYTVISDNAPHYANTPMQYTAIFHGCQNVNFQMIFLKIFFLFLLKTLIV